MRIKVLLLSISVIGLTVCTGRLALAQAAAGFQPLTSSDAPHIVQAGFGVYNNDTTASRSITSSLGALTAPLAGVLNLEAYIYNSGGGTSSCTPYAADTSITSVPITTGTSGSSSAPGQVHFPLQLGLTAGHLYAISVICSLSKSPGGGNNTTLWAVVEPPQ